MRGLDEYARAEVLYLWSGALCIVVRKAARELRTTEPRNAAYRQGNTDITREVDPEAVHRAHSVELQLHAYFLPIEIRLACTAFKSTDPCNAVYR